MQPKVKANSIVTTRIVSRAPLVLGFTVVGFEEQLLHVDEKVHADNREYAAIHGWGQRVPDKAAVPSEDKDGVAYTVKQKLQMKFDGICSVIAHYESGSADWSMKGTRTVREAVVDHTLTIAAMMEAFGKDASAVDAMVQRGVSNGMGTRTAILDSFAGRADVGAIVQRMRAEASKGIDTDSLVDGMEG